MSEHVHDYFPRGGFAAWTEAIRTSKPVVYECACGETTDKAPAIRSRDEGGILYLDGPRAGQAFATCGAEEPSEDAEPLFEMEPERARALGAAIMANAKPWPGIGIPERGT